MSGAEFFAMVCERIGLTWAWNRLPYAVGRAAMRVGGVEFFDNRLALQRDYPLDEMLGKTSQIDAVSIIGRVLHESRLQNIRRIRRIIFPNPESHSAINYAKTVGEIGHFQRNIAETTKSLTEKGIEVRWYSDTIGFSFLIGDGETKNGWVQVEMFMPFSVANLRPSIRVQKNKHEEFVNSMMRYLIKCGKRVISQMMLFLGDTWEIKIEIFSTL